MFQQRNLSFVVLCFRQEFNVTHTHEKHCCLHVNLWDVVNSSVTLFIFLILVQCSCTMVEVDEDPQLGLESEEDDEVLSDGEVRIWCIYAFCSGSAVLHYDTLSCYRSRQGGKNLK